VIRLLSAATPTVRDISPRVIALAGDFHDKDNND